MTLQAHEREFRKWVVCPACGPQEPRLHRSGQVDHPPPDYDYRLGYCSVCGSVGRIKNTRVPRPGKKKLERCGGKCLGGNPNGTCDCACRGRCHGAGRCYCGQASGGAPAQTTMFNPPSALNVEAQRLNRKVQLLLDTIDVARELPSIQVFRGVASLTKAQWTAADDRIKGVRRGKDLGTAFGRSDDAAEKAFERWKARIRELGLEASTPEHLLDGPPVFSFDLTRAERELDEAQAQLGALRAVLPRGKIAREYTVEEIADELGIATPQIVRSWAQQGMPHERRVLGKGQPRYVFNLDEVKAWVREHGSKKAIGSLARATITAEELGRVIAEAGSMTAARERLGLSDSQFRDLRRELKVHVPVRAQDRARAWEVLRRDELLAAIERHEGRRSGIVDELGLSPYELRQAIVHHGLADHALVLRPRAEKPFTREQLLAAVERHAGLRDEIASELGVSRGYLRDAILDYDLDDHPLLQFGRVAYKAPPTEHRGAGRGAPGQPGLRARGHALETPVAPTDRLVPFWLAALRELLARFPGRGAARRVSEATGISPPQLTNLLKGNRLPGYEYMVAIMNAAGRSEPPWREALRELVDRHKSELDRARGTAAPVAAVAKVAGIVGASPQTILGLLGGTPPSMEMIRRLLEATGRPYMVESVEQQQMIGAGSGRPKVRHEDRLTRDQVREALLRAGGGYKQAAELLHVRLPVLKRLVEHFQLAGEFPLAPRGGRPGLPRPRSRPA